MKRLIIIPIFIFVAAGVSGQLVRPNRPLVILDGKSGYITVNEFVAGTGLAGLSTPFSKGYFGFTTMHGFQANETFMVGAGTGVFYYYGDGLLIPLYADIRIRLSQSFLAPCLSGAAGMLLNPENFDAGTRMFINPAAGLLYSSSRKLAINFSAGLHIQMAPNISRASFLNIKGGFTYKF